MAGIERSWFERHPLDVALDLLGMTIVIERNGTRAGGTIVEVEAYADVDDLASHAATLRAGRAALSDQVGCLYMYRSYGIHTMLNIVAHQPNSAGAVLIRALEPTIGIDAMHQRRGADQPELLTSGPGKLCQALGLQLTDLGFDLLDQGEIRLNKGFAPSRILAGPRIGISKSTGRLWRLFDGDSSFVSAHRLGVPVESIAEILEHVD